MSISVDGTPTPNDGGATSTAVQHPDRGSHSVSAQVSDRAGKSVCTASTTFHVQRPTVNTPTRVPPRPPRPTPH